MNIKRNLKNQNIDLPFNKKLVLNQYILSLFGVRTFEEIADVLRNENLEGLDENNHHHFYNQILIFFPSLYENLQDSLKDYDENIVRHTIQINSRRLNHGEKPIVWKYFQYIALFFTEIYLDKFFNNALSLRECISQKIQEVNDNLSDKYKIKAFDEANNPELDANKISYWIATGGGKTLLMHINILQYIHYIEKYGKKSQINRVILLTPNEGLSYQHISEFKKSGINAESFSKDKSIFNNNLLVEVVEITKIKDEMGDKTIAVSAFESNNLVLIDEGHRGASGGSEGAWMKYRNLLCESGFSFEYSATFSQAVKGDNNLTSLYAKNILCDYSYRYFYNDGFGKDFQILNIDNNMSRQNTELYLTASVLTCYQQIRVYKDNEKAYKNFHIEKPLWVFVGSKVTATLAEKDASDIIEIIKFFTRFIQNRNESMNNIRILLSAGLVTADGRNLFSRQFTYLNSLKLTAEQTFSDILQTLFNSTAEGLLYMENLKGAPGEIALKIGIDNTPFGLINVGDDSKLLKKCRDHRIPVIETEFAKSQFKTINNNDSSINILIGSKKFSEGWSSWRVSTMGLMNVGASEGSQIIQLFGRGVRLKGYDFKLKRSNRISFSNKNQIPKDLRLLETLSIFGIHADYMTQFKIFLEEEGVPTNEERIEYFLPVIKNLGNRGLKTIRVKSNINGVSSEFGIAFRKLAPKPILSKPPEQIKLAPLVLNRYPQVGAIISNEIKLIEQGIIEVGYFNPQHISFLDLNRIYYELERYKAERGWYNLTITRKSISELLLDRSWYKILIPNGILKFNNYKNVLEWQEIATILLKKYTERYYNYKKKEWELPHLEYVDVNENDSNFPCHEDESAYRIIMDNESGDFIEKLKELEVLIKNGTLNKWTFRGLSAYKFDRHLYYPILSLSNGLLDISPLPLNAGENRFLNDLSNYYKLNVDYFSDKEMYLLRNLSKGKGVGFFEAGNFYPDFIMWVIKGEKQYISFIDPKGLRNIGENDPKISFYLTIKDIERRLEDNSITLNSFIVSNTSSVIVESLWGLSKDGAKSKNILFQDEDNEIYIREMFDKLLLNKE